MCARCMLRVCVVLAGASRVGFICSFVLLVILLSSPLRFYFVGDEDLLEIIGNSKNVPKLQKHFKKMFAGVAALILSEDDSLVLGISSREGEQVQCCRGARITIELVISAFCLESIRTASSILCGIEVYVWILNNRQMVLSVKFFLTF